MSDLLWWEQQMGIINYSDLVVDDDTTNGDPWEEAFTISLS